MSQPEPNASQTGALTRKNLVSIMTALAIWSGLFLAAALLGRVAALPQYSARWLSAMLCITGVFLVFYQFLDVRQSRSAWVASVAFTGAIAFLFLRFGTSENWRAFIHSLFLVLFTFCLGRALSFLVDEKQYLVPVGMVASLADVWSVFGGLTKKMVESQSPIMQTVVSNIMVSMPVAPIQEGEALRIEPIAGGTDFLFIALFLGIARKFDLSIKHSSVAMFIGLAGGLSLTVLLQSFDYLTSGLPGLPFLAVSFIGVHWREVKPGTKEMVTTIVFCLVAVLLMVFYRMAKG